ncbi:hypothetical protein ABIA39_005731 [Nocardia sp. GAS34]|uniref:hypothetical protein n=1 Tax=unclassified Nocardia TaxID=2637762 RepID=UPI003D1D516A
MSGNDMVVELLATAAQLHGYTVQVTSDGELFLTGPAGTAAVRLDDLLRRAAAAPPQDWPALAADYLATDIARLEAERKLPLEAQDFATGKPLIRTRLYGNDFREPPGSVSRALPCGLLQRVVLDGVHTMSAITYQDLDRWPIEEAELFVLAEHNTLTDGRADLIEPDFPDDAPPWYVLDGGEYTSAHALWLCDYPVTSPRGAVFAIPTHLRLYAAPITTVTILRAVHVLAQISAQRHRTDPSPVSPHLYHTTAPSHRLSTSNSTTPP